MNKSELASTIAEQTGLTKKDAANAMNATFEAIEGALKKGERVSFIGFGTFDVRLRAARQGVNPSTGAKIKIAEKAMVKFKAGSGLSDSVNKPKLRKALKAK